MKSVVIILGLIALASCNTFLRQLAVTKASSFDKTCVTTIGNLVATLDDSAANGDAIAFELNPDTTGTVTAANKYTYAGSASAAGTTITCTTTTTGKTPLEGKYKFESIQYTPKSSGTAGPITTTASLTYATEYTLAASQTASQKVEGDTKTFSVKFSAFTTAPKIFANNTATVAIPCTADDKKETLTCTPTKDHMEAGKKYKVVYQKACEGDKAETGVEVEYNGASLLKYSFFLLALFLL